MQLSSWDKEELDDKLANRVQVSKRAVSKVVQAFDRLSQRNEKITLALKGEFDGGKCYEHIDSKRFISIYVARFLNIWNFFFFLKQVVHVYPICLHHVTLKFWKNV